MQRLQNKKICKENCKTYVFVCVCVCVCVCEFFFFFLVDI